MAKKEINTRTLGGWLIPIQVFIIVNAISWVGNLQLYYELLGKTDSYLKEKQITDTAVYTVFVYYELAASLVFAFGSFVVFYFFYKRNRYFPAVMIIFLAAEVVVEAVSYFLFSHLAPDNTLMLQKLIFSIAVAALIIVYLKISERVKLTYIF